MIERLYHALARRWPMVVAYSLAGAAVLWAYSLARAHPYRAVAAVAVHHNAESALPDATSFQLNEYINRETALLETVAYSDEVWEAVFESLAEEGWLSTPDERRTLFDQTRLPHPMDGEWQFVAAADDPALAARLANRWAESFVAVVNEGVAMAFEAEALRARVWDQVRLLSNAKDACLHTSRIASQVEELTQGLSVPAAAPEVQAQLLRLAAGLEMPCQMPGCGPGASAEEIAALADALALAASIDLRACEDAVVGLQEDLDRAAADAAAAVGPLELSPYLEVSFLRRAQTPEAPYVPTGWYLIVGGVLGMAARAAREVLCPPARAQPRDKA